MDGFKPRPQSKFLLATLKYLCYNSGGHHHKTVGGCHFLAKGGGHMAEKLVAIVLVLTLFLVVATGYLLVAIK
jgi:hypothetical protein